VLFLQSGAQECDLQCQTVSKNMLWVCTFKGFKMFGKWGYLIKRLSGQQGVKGQVVQVEWWEHLGKCL